MKKEKLTNDLKSNGFTHKNWILDRVAVCASNKDLNGLLIGEEGFFFENRGIPGTHDYGVVLYSGIYPYYESDHEIKNLFEEALLHLLQGTDYNLLVAFEYAWRQRSCELRGSAPFAIDNACVEALKDEIKKREESLKLYKEYYYWGGSLKEGAFEYIRNILKSINEEYFPETEEQRY